MASLAKLKDARKRDVASAILYRARQGASIAKHLSAAAVVAGDVESQAVADLIAEASRVENIWHAQDLTNGDGECFAGYGSLNVPSSRLSPDYMALSSRRSRPRVVHALDRCRPQSGENLRMVTLTMPHLQGVGFAKTIALFDDARARLRKRKWFIETFRGGVFGEEFTLGVDGDSYHVHCHVLAWSKWVVWTRLGDEWSDCLERAAMARGIPLEFSTSHNRAVVDVRLVTQKRRGKGTISHAGAVQEVAKYITKGNTFTELAPLQLIEVERSLRGRRMVETFGDANLRKGKPTQDAAIDGERPYLDKQDTVDGKGKLIRARKPRLEPLRVLGARMIAAGRRRQWLETLREVFRRRAEWRKRQLATRFPYATFSTLAGEVWYGVELQGDETHLTLAN